MSVDNAYATNTPSPAVNGRNSDGLAKMQTKLRDKRNGRCMPAE